MDKLNPEDYYIENDKYIFTVTYLLRRGYCCGNLCKHCPYGKDIQRAASGKKLNGDVGKLVTPAVC